ncbi:unnamed protein product [Cylindrotheca closterium]|uniref:Uncharacterized protein n=1 Tax=Cylindrotheca closterium TaxID=2856 RepID=A0AAD2FKQ6_9STRA|nr:unnamed protein product [Cylindrotheca closterium]
MQRPPIFRVARRRDYVNGTVQRDWFTTRTPKDRENIIEDMRATAPKVPPHKCGVLVLIGDYVWCPIWALLLVAASFGVIEIEDMEALMRNLSVDNN